MPYDLTRPLVIGISSRALFDLEAENRLYEEQGLAAYESYQVSHETVVLQKGAAFPLVRAFLELNSLQEERLVEVIVTSRNSPNTSLRIFHSIQSYGLDITRAALTGGAEIAPYLKAFARFLETVAHIQSTFAERDPAPVRTALVTSRSVPAHERAIKTLRSWGVHVDEAYFLGGVSKKEVLSAFGAQIFFDDQYVHADPASEVVPAAVVPYREGDGPLV